MSAILLDEVLEKIELLAPEEQQQVISVLSEKAMIQHSKKDKPKKEMG